MDFLSVKPGLLFWSIVNFILFLGALYFIGGKNFIKNIIAREKYIKESIEAAERTNLEAKKLAEENEIKLKYAYKTVDDIVKKGKEQAQEQANMIIVQAKNDKNAIIEQAKEEIERNKKIAMQEMRGEVADLVVKVTEKILEEKLTSETDKQLIQKYIEQIPTNNE